jgi:hypothetical protein
MFERIKKLFGNKDALSGVAAQAQNLASQAKAAYNDVAADGIGLDDLAKIKDHATDLAAKATDVITDAKAVVQNIQNNDTPVA